MSLPTDETVKALLGERVRVTINDGKSEVGGPAVITTGQLIGFGQGGDFEILEDDGFIHYCWPMLDIEAVNP